MLDASSGVTPQHFGDIALTLNVLRSGVHCGKTDMPSQDTFIIASDPQVQLIAEQVSEAGRPEVVERGAP